MLWIPAWAEAEVRLTWLRCTEGMAAAGTDVWLGEFGRDLHGPMANCCFFLSATTFWATAETYAHTRYTMQRVKSNKPKFFFLYGEEIIPKHPWIQETFVSSLLMPLIPRYIILLIHRQSALGPAQGCTGSVLNIWESAKVSLLRLWQQGIQPLEGALTLHIIISHPYTAAHHHKALVNSLIFHHHARRSL